MKFFIMLCAFMYSSIHIAQNIFTGYAIDLYDQRLSNATLTIEKLVNVNAIKINTKGKYTFGNLFNSLIQINSASSLGKTLNQLNDLSSLNTEKHSVKTYLI